MCSYLRSGLQNFGSSDEDRRRTGAIESEAHNRQPSPVVEVKDRRAKNRGEKQISRPMLCVWAAGAEDLDARLVGCPKLAVLLRLSL